MLLLPYTINLLTAILLRDWVQFLRKKNVSRIFTPSLLAGKITETCWISLCPESPEMKILPLSAEVQRGVNFL